MPMGNEIHIDVPLSNMSLAAFNKGGDYVAGKLFPVVNVDKQSDKYYVIDQDSWMRINDTKRAPKTEAKRVEWKQSSDSFYADNYALATDNALESLSNADAAVRLRETGVSFLTDQLLKDYENRVATLVRSNVLATVNNSTNGINWDATNSADIVTQVQDAKLAVFQRTGLVPNTMVIDYQSMNYAQRNTRAKTTFANFQEGLLSLQQLASLWGLNPGRILIANALQNPGIEKTTVSNPGVGSYYSIWGPTCLLAYVPMADAMGIQTVSYGASFRWTPAGMPAAFQVGMQTFAGAGTKNVEVIEAGYYQDEKVLSNALAYRINTKSGMVW